MKRHNVIFLLAGVLLCVASAGAQLAVIAGGA
jgi:hypothetical protein